ncbi:hypothetical protein [Kitasatospora sp. GAS1066B]|uniref:hypothetical protein n=1 Tax=Kitasatospora sp. GAS1066B TaxID=3156271 RepID=UPI0035164FA6
MPEYPPSPTRGGLLVAVEVLASVHDRHDSDRSDPGTGSSGDGPWPDGDGLNNPA